ncbi:hypothetical protein DEA8626_00545 [Defluviimonas aquaemixtae]|uniref:MACPF domain-containing protein n=1 Tax=Albidovulum aquaemixtae TaxID=1542388 RepID=A0A2R8B302_9RHOB|nr:MAC/perforin domain-containing protein [Defluviimonas aquaemixtae]SPH17031.1 hypothetical protein DEA8626_00545 [Defluviimonas aquaemixtae]
MRVSTNLAAIFTASLTFSTTAGSEDLDLAGIWRDETAQVADKKLPVQVDLPDGDSSPHGTYVSLPYIAILRAKSGALHFYTDVGAMQAEVQPVAGTPGSYNLADLTPGANGKVLGVLKASTEGCAPRPACFQLEPPPGADAAAFPLPSGDLKFYVPIDPYDPSKDPKQDQTYGSNFAPVSGNFDYVTFCYNINGLDPYNIQKNTGCRNVLFQVPDTNSYSYQKVGYASGGNADIPFGWTYKSDDQTIGSSKARTIDTGRDMANSDSLDIGVNASVSLFGFNAKTSVNVGTSHKIQELSETKSVVAEMTEVKSKFALVLNRYYTTLSPDFVTTIRNLKGKPAADKAYEVVISEWGTHYPNAVTFGARGSRKLTLNEEAINSLRDSQTNISAGLSVDYEGSGGGVDVKSAQEAMSSIKKIVTTENRDFRCYGGGDCSEDGVPSGADIVPIFLDLRPLSDLLAPPFFSDEEILGQIRINLARAILKAAYVERNDLNAPTLSAVQAVNPTGTPLGAPQLLCGDLAVTTRPTGNPSPLMSTYCCVPQAVAEPVVAAMSLKGTTDPLTRPAGLFRRPISIDPAQPVNLPTAADPAPFISSVTVDYLFLHQRDDTDTTGVYTPDLNSYCQTTYGDGWSGTVTGQIASCISGSATNQINVQQVCAAQHGGSSYAAWSDVEGAWLCGFGSQLPVDVTTWCKAQFGPTSVGSGQVWPDLDVPRYIWSCTPGGQVDAGRICTDMAGRSYKPTFVNEADSNGNLICQGVFAEVRTAVPVDGTVLTYPDLKPYDATSAAVGSPPANVIVPLNWTGDSAVACGGVSLDLVIALQKVGADALLTSP